MSRMICFDMDGTIADLYGVPNWLEKLHSEDASPYLDADPLTDMDELREVLETLVSQGWEIRVISWLARDSSESYKAVVRQAKRDWLDYYDFPADHVHLVAYGTTKADCVRRAADAPCILIDDNEKIRNGWHLGKTIDPQEVDIIEALWELVE